MLESEVIFYIVKLIFGGITAFLAILLLSRTRDSAWIFMICGAIFSYAGLVFELLLKIGIVSDFSGNSFSSVSPVSSDCPLCRLFMRLFPARHLKNNSTPCKSRSTISIP